jgi:DNA-binding NtrC family response regulator
VGEDEVRLGRDREASDWSVADSKLSKCHARFSATKTPSEIRVTDLGSTNGTYVGGARIPPGSPVVLHDQAVVACGRLILVFEKDIRPVVVHQAGPGRFGMAGRFYSPVLLAQAAEAASMSLHVLLSGQSGTGKELVARAFSHFFGEATGSPPGFVAHNCARFASEEEAMTTLFGVGPGVFSGVRERQGLLEEAAGGVLFLDEIHVLSARVQRSLLRFVEDGVCSRIGEDRRRKLELRVVLGTNIPVEEGVAHGSLAFDLVNRLHRLHLPPLDERRADVADIFIYHLHQAARRIGARPEEIASALRPSHLEAVSLLDFSEKNARELVHLAEGAATRIHAARRSGRIVLGELLSEQYPKNPVVIRSARPPSDEASGRGSRSRNRRAEPETSSPSRSRRSRRRGWGRSRYERNREEIVSAFHEVGQNVSAAARLLEQRGIKVTRRWLAKYLERWGER